MVAAIVLRVACFVRVVHYLWQRVSVTSASSDPGMLFAVDYIQDHVYGDSLTLIVTNRNCDILLSHLANFIKRRRLMSGKQADSVGAQELEKISIKFECTLYHKLYKEDILQVLI